MRRRTLLNGVFLFLTFAGCLSLPAVTNGIGAVNEICSPQNELVARYQVTFRNSDGKNVKQVHLWRGQNQVAIHYPESHVTELWEYSKNQRLHLVRYFEEYKRGIEYQANEIGGRHDWSEKFQLISDAMIKGMQLDKVTGKSCKVLERYSLNEDGKKSKLKWLARQRLVKYYKEKTNSGTTIWELISVNHDKNKVKEKFSTLNDYQSTDYADIGDNESDPFLLNMINLGFVEHGATGFYDAEGNKMDSHRHHHH